MKLIFERIGGKDYMYVETEKHYIRAKKFRDNKKKITVDQLNNERNLSHYGSDFYFECDIKK